MSYWRFSVCLCCIHLGIYAGSTHTSKACFGGSDRTCHFHKIHCQDQLISICDAYYTDNRECAKVYCSKIDLDSVVEVGHHKFSETNLASLYNDCDTRNNCKYHAKRQGIDLTFSVVKYQCFDKLDGTHGDICADVGTNVGAAVGGVVASVLVVVIIVIVTLWYLRKRRGNKGDKSVKHQDQETQRKARDTPQSHYQEIDDSQIRGRSNKYDYATADGVQASPNSHAYFTIEPITGPNVQHNSPSTSKEDDYDHIGDKPFAFSSNYDTTASVSQIVGTRANSREDDYGYNRLQEVPGTKTVQNDYDTTTAADRAV